MRSDHRTARMGERMMMELMIDVRDVRRVSDSDGKMR